MPNESALTPGRFTRLLLVTVLVAGLALMAWQIVQVLLLVFGAILLAVLLKRSADWLAAHSPLSGGWALAVVLMAIIAVLVICGWLFGAQVSSQVEQLTRVVPEAWGRVREQLEGSSWGRAALDAVSGVDPASVSGGMVREAGSLIMTVVGGLGNVLLLVAGGVYLAAQPGLYREGVVALMPKSAEARAREVLTPWARRWASG